MTKADYVRLAHSAYPTATSPQISAILGAKGVEVSAEYARVALQRSKEHERGVSLAHEHTTSRTGGALRASGNLPVNSPRRDALASARGF